MLSRVIREVKHNQSSCSSVELSQSRILSEGLALHIMIECEPASLLGGLLGGVVGGRETAVNARLLLIIGCCEKLFGHHYHVLLEFIVTYHLSECILHLTVDEDKKRQTLSPGSE